MEIEYFVELNHEAAWKQCFENWKERECEKLFHRNEKTGQSKREVKKFSSLPELKSFKHSREREEK